MHSLPLTKLTKLSPEWKLGWFLLDYRKFEYSINYYNFFFRKSLNSRLLMKFALWSKTNKDKSTEMFPPLFIKRPYTLYCAVLCNAESLKSSTKGSNFLEDKEGGGLEVGSRGRCSGYFTLAWDMSLAARARCTITWHTRYWYKH